MYTFSAIAFLALLGLALATSFNKRILTLFVAWAIIGGIVAYSGFFENTSALPPRFVFLVIPGLLIVIYTLKTIDINQVKLSWLLAIHIIRIPVELILYQLYQQGLIPVSMTYEGWNWDILSGLSAVVMLKLYLFKLMPTVLLKIWNWMALGLLLVIVFTAVLSAPSPFQQLAFEQPNLAVIRFPFTWLPSIVVPIVLLSHILIFRKLKSRPSID